jgi:hypothetical protein
LVSGTDGRLRLRCARLVRPHLFAFWKSVLLVSVRSAGTTRAPRGRKTRGPALVGARVVVLRLAGAGLGEGPARTDAEVRSPTLESRLFDCPGPHLSPPRPTRPTRHGRAGVSHGGVATTGADVRGLTGASRRRLMPCTFHNQNAGSMAGHPLRPRWRRRNHVTLPRPGSRWRRRPHPTVLPATRCVPAPYRPCIMVLLCEQRCFSLPSG